MNWLKFGLAAAGIAAIFAAIGKLAEDKENEKLDDYLMNDDDEDEIIILPETANGDKEIWLEMEEEDMPVTVYYKVDNKENAVHLQQMLADAGLNSIYDDETGTVEALYTGGTEEAQALENACTLPYAKYQGFQTAD